MRLDSTSGQWRESRQNTACDRAALLITRQIDGVLTTDDARFLRAHLPNCPECRSTLAMQSEQARTLSKELHELWKQEDRLARKKKARGALKPFDIQDFSKLTAYLIFLSGLAYFATTASAPRDGPNNALMTPHVPPASINLEGAAIVPQPGVAPQTLPGEYPALQETHPAVSTHVAGETLAFWDETIFQYDVPEQDLAGGVPEARVSPETKAMGTPAIVPETGKIAQRSNQTLAALSEPAPLKALAGVELNYSIRSATGTTSEGHATVLGDVLHGKGVVRIATAAGEIMEAAQADIETAFDEPHRSAARRLLNECADPRNRKRIEEALRK